MSPFSRFLKRIRFKRGFQQKQLALYLGYEPSYISALERGTKGPPRQDFIRRLIKGLSLNQDEQTELEEAIKASRRHFSIPRCATDAELQMVHELAPRLGNLTPLQIQLIKLALAISPKIEGRGEAICQSNWEDRAM